MKKHSLSPQRGFFPQPVYLIGTYKEDGSTNFAMITWITFCSVNPPKIMFSSRGKKLTRELLEKNKRFSVNLVNTDMMNMADYFGNTSGYNKNKCEDIQAEYFKGEALEVPILEKSPWVYECLLTDAIKEGEGNTYIGEVKNILVDDNIKDTSYGKIDLINLKPLIYAPGHYYKLEKAIGEVGSSIK